MVMISVYLRSYSVSIDIGLSASDLKVQESLDQHM